MNVRQTLNNSGWIGWILVVLLLGVSTFLYTRLSPSRVQYSVERMTEMVTIRDAETNEEWKMRRGELEKLLRGREGALSDKQGLPNPKTGRMTGFPKNSDWDETIARLNREREEVTSEAKGSASRSSTRPPKIAGEN